jgi:outer membrane protein TolC
MALENNSEIKIKKLEIESKKNSLISEKSLYYPNLKAASSISKAENSESNYGSSITLSQSLFRGGEIKSSVDKAELNLKVSEEELNLLKNSKRVEIVNLYIAALKYENQLKIYKNIEYHRKKYPDKRPYQCFFDVHLMSFTMKYP